MLIVNPITGSTREDAWFYSIEMSPINNEYIKVGCNLIPDFGSLLYKDPMTFEQKSINLTDVNSRQIYLMVNKHIFYKNVFGTSYQAPFDDAEARPQQIEIPTPIDDMDYNYDQYQRIINKTKMKKVEFTNVINTIFKDYPYGLPLGITGIKQNIKSVVNNNDLQIDDPDDFNDDILWLTNRELDEALDHGSVYMDDDGNYFEDGSDRPVRIVFNTTTNGRTRIQKYKWYDVTGYYWPIKNSNLNNFASYPDKAGYAIYSSENIEHKKVFTKNFNSINICTLNHENIIQAVIKHGKAVILDTKQSSEIFGKQLVKKKMMLNDKNINGYEIVNIIPDYNCIKDGVKRDIIVLKGDLNYKFCLSDVKIVFPFANSILKGIIPTKDKTLKPGLRAKIVNDKSLKIGRGEIVTIIAVQDNYYANSDINQHKVVTVADKGNNRFKVWSNCLKVI